MCVAIVQFRPETRLPVVVGFNRDEVPERDAGMPAVFIWRDRRVLAAREPVHGGTWLGLNDAGLVVGLLDREPSDDPTSRDPDAEQPRGVTTVRSRGLLVLDCLARTSVEGVEGVEGELHSLAEPYEPFNLFAMDAQSALAAHYVEDGLRDVQRLSPGIHVFAHRDVDDLDLPKVARVHSACRRGEGSDESDWVGTFASCLSMHDDDPASHASPCRHGTGYRTLCSTVLTLEGWRPLRGRFLHAPGPPCTTPYQDLTALIGQLSEP